MIRRCHDENFTAYKNYGGRGITVCDEWRMSFTAFINDMYGTYFEGATLDRIDNNKGYSKENCRWITSAEQQLNTRSNVYGLCNGELVTQTKASKMLGGEQSLVRNRLKSGWDKLRAFNTPVLK